MEVNGTAHCCVGVISRTEKILACSFPRFEDPFAADLAMSKRLGATPEEFAHIKKVRRYVKAQRISALRASTNK
jgi:hypothetical protein